MMYVYTNGVEGGKQDKDGMKVEVVQFVQGRVSGYPWPCSFRTCDRNAVAGKWQARPLIASCGPSAINGFFLVLLVAMLNAME
jgi:hypothetical protein